MPDEQQPVPDFGDAPGWYVTDPDGNVVDSGPLTEAKPVFKVGEIVGDYEGDE